MAKEMVRVSHEIDDFSASSMYPGGTNTVTGAHFGLWDYGGTMAPDSNCALVLELEPTDGSNEGKPHTEYWNIGDSGKFRPDSENDGHMVSEPGVQPSQQCNFFQLLKSFRDSCGIEKGRLSTDVGVKALIGSSITFIRVDPPAREFKDDNMPTASGAPRAPRGKAKQILVANSAHWAWEGGAKKGKAAAPAAAKVTPAPAAKAAAAAAGTTDNGDNPVIGIIAGLLNANDGAFELSKLAAAVTEGLSTSGVTAGRRLKLIKSVTDRDQLAALASSNGWEVDVENGMVILL